MSASAPADPTSKTVKCPHCGGPSLFAPSNPYRPFCSERCKNIDFGAWASESFRVPAQQPPDDQVFGDAAKQ